MRYLFSFFIASVLFISCSKYGEMCMPPPPSIAFRLMDNSNNDLFANGIINQSAITIKDETQRSCQYNVQGNDTIAVIRIFDLNKGNHTYKLTAGTKSVDFSINIVNGKCGSYIEEEKIISPSSFTKTPGFYVIKFP